MTAVRSFADELSTSRMLRPKRWEWLEGVLQRSNLTSSNSLRKRPNRFNSRHHAVIPSLFQPMNRRKMRRTAHTPTRHPLGLPPDCGARRTSFGASAEELNQPVLANAKTDKPDYQQDGSGYHHPIRIFHR